MVSDAPVTNSTDSAPLEAPSLPTAGDSVVPMAATPVSGDPAAAETVAPRERPSLGDDGLPEGWVVQVGSFAEADNAAALKERLLAAGFRAYERRRQTLTTLFVGPVLDQAEGQALQATLLADFGLEGLVKRYELEALR